MKSLLKFTFFLPNYPSLVFPLKPPNVPDNFTLETQIYRYVSLFAIKEQKYINRGREGEGTILNFLSPADKRFSLRGWGGEGVDGIVRGEDQQGNSDVGGGRMGGGISNRKKSIKHIKFYFPTFYRRKTPIFFSRLDCIIL